METAIHVYSTATSHLVRTLQTNPGQRIIGYKLCPINPEHLYVVTSTGSVSKRNWITGNRISHWDTCRKTISIDFSFDTSASDTYPLFYSLCERKDGKREIRMLSLLDEKSWETVVLETNTQINHIRVAKQSQTIVASGACNLILGTLNNPSLDSVENAQYTWREVTLPFSITCLDIRENKRRAAQGPEDKKAFEQLDLVLGEAHGSILIYQDVLGLFIGSEDTRDGGKSFAPRRLHWHRGPVSALRWSRDGELPYGKYVLRGTELTFPAGNYIISGGQESVIVLWQLDTGRKQYLPHLSSAICNIVVSPTGNSYAIKLADNSTIVLSARELQPYATIIGLQLPPKMGKLKDSSPCDTTAAVLHPQYPDQLLVAVPASRQNTQDGHSLANSPVLQTYNIFTNKHISRQALARTNTTILKISPEGSEITTPDIKHLSMSHDGKCMATVDSWSPFRQDTKAFGLSYIGDSTRDHEENFLKFWKWNKSSSLWELVTRIDGPHFSGHGPAPVLGLVSRPHSNEFVTIGADAILRIWCPNQRLHSGLKTGPDLVRQVETWRCRNTIDLKGNINSNKTGNLDAACLTFSEDGSVLAVCLPSESTENPNLALLVDAQQCIIYYSRAGAYRGDPCAAKFLGRHLIIASKHSVSVWDTVDDLVRIPRSPIDALPAGKSQTLAVSSKTRTFAVATQRLQNRPGNSARKSRTTDFYVQVYDIESLEPVFSISMEKCPLALLSDLHSGDYIVVDAATNVQRIGCSDRTSQTTTRFPELSTSLNSGLVDLFGSQGPSLQPRSVPTMTKMDTDDHFSKTRGLSGVFGEVPSFVLPSASVLFKNVVHSLYSK